RPPPRSLPFPYTTLFRSAWDEDGRLFVAEMTDYPIAPTGGRVKLLEDRDGDRKYERVTVFAEKLAFPNGVLPWDGGLLVTAAPRSEEHTSELQSLTNLVC